MKKVFNKEFLKTEKIFDKKESNLNLILSEDRKISQIIPNIMYLCLENKAKKIDQVIEVKNLSISFGDRIVIDNVSFTIRKGTIIGFIGESGAGKSVTIKSLIGEQKFDGSVKVMGIKSEKINKISSFIGYVPEDVSLIYEYFTPMENLIHFGRQYGLEEEQITRRAKKILEDLQIPEYMDFPVKNLSGGQKKRVSIAIAMIHEPEILILDEPTSGLDPMMRFELWKFLDFINKKYQITLIVISHYLDEVEYCDRSAVYLKGIGLFDFDTPENLKKNLPGKGTCLEITLKDINLEFVKKLEKIDSVEEVIQRGKKIRLLSNNFRKDIIEIIKKCFNEMGTTEEKIENDIVVDMIDYFTVKSRHFGETELLELNQEIPENNNNNKKRG